MLSEIKLFLLDMDGTIYLGDQPIEGAREAVAALRTRARVCFLTNNSSKSRAQYFDKLQRLGFDPDMSEIFTSGDAAAKLVRDMGRVWVLGTRALKAQIAQCAEVVEDRPDTVLLGYDTEMTYDRLAKACVYIREGARYVATHHDINCPHPSGYLPDAGAFMALIKASTGRDPDIICGKPYSVMAQAIQDRYGLKSSEIAMIGDRLYTDIAFGRNNGFYSILVLSGETTQDMHNASPHKADLVLDGIKSLL